MKMDKSQSTVRWGGLEIDKLSESLEFLNFLRSAHATNPVDDVFAKFFDVFANFLDDGGAKSFFEIKFESARSISSKNRRNRSYPRDFSTV